MNVRRRAAAQDWGRILGAWLDQHAQSFFFSIGQMARNPIGSLLTTAVIGISLALPASFYLMLVNARQVTAGWGGTARISVFMKLDVSEDRARAMAEQLARHAQVEDVHYVSREEALAEYERLSGLGEALRYLDENPLPAMLLVQPRLQGLSGGAGDRLIAELRGLPGVDSAEFDRQWVQRLIALLQIFQRAVIILATLLAVAVLLIIGNTIRLAIYNRRAEIEINKLFGATNAFIRRPFLYSGLMHGLGGAVLALILLHAGLWLLSGPVARLADLYLSEFTLGGLGAREALCLLGAGGFLGLAGSWLAVQRHLDEIGPL
ncbi:MAG: permease-like cell division protein FtsX [Burkholderiales bacterium]